MFMCNRCLLNFRVVNFARLRSGSTKLKGPTNLSNGFFCSFEMVCKSSVCSFHWLRFIVFGFLRGYESIVNEVLMVGHWLFHFEGAGLMCTSPLGCCEWMFPFTLERTFVLTRVSFKSQKMCFLLFEVESNEEFALDIPNPPNTW